MKKRELLARIEALEHEVKELRAKLAEVDARPYWPWVSTQVRYDPNTPLPPSVTYAVTGADAPALWTRLPRTEC